MLIQIYMRTTALIIMIISLVKARHINEYAGGVCLYEDFTFNEYEDQEYERLADDEDNSNSTTHLSYVVLDQYPQLVLPVDLTGRFDILNPDVNPDGLVLYEGDMVMNMALDTSEEEEEFLIEDLERKFTSFDESLWPADPETGLPNVPFVISPEAERSRKDILAAISMWENGTCITFKELDGPRNTSHINFIRRAGCWSFVGRQFKKIGPQPLSVGGGCQKPGVIAHEIGHSLGMLHEQSRNDRDDHVVIIWDNIKPRKHKNFKKRLSDNANVPYDTSSIMHYGGAFFSKSGNPTLVTRNPYHQRFLGQRDELTFRDLHIANSVYRCLDRWFESCENSSLQCQNGGYVGRQCKCMCPKGTEGDQCQFKSGHYYPPLPCGGNVTAPLNISSPNYPNPFPPHSVCMWWAQAAKCQQVRLTFHSFNLLIRSSGQCSWDYLEIRVDDPIMPGKTYCGCEIKRGQEFHSKNGSIFISFHGRLDLEPGFFATIDFAPDPSCFDSNDVVNEVTEVSAIDNNGKSEVNEVNATDNYSRGEVNKVPATTTDNYVKSEVNEVSATNNYGKGEVNKVSVTATDNYVKSEVTEVSATDNYVKSEVNEVSATDNYVKSEVNEFSATDNYV